MAEYEVLLEDGSYQADVLGIDAEEKLSSDDLKHSVPKFRME